MPARPSLAIARLTGLATALCLSGHAASQEEEPVWDTDTELELGAVFTSGNTDEENLRVGADFGASREDWSYSAEFDGRRSSTNDELTAERFYLVGSTRYSYNEDDFAQLRASHERDEFSGFEQQSDVVASYGQLLLSDRENMTLDYTVGAGIRHVDDGLERNNEAVFRVSSNYTWDLNDNARLVQEISSDSGSSARITRSVSSIESDVLGNMSLRFSVRLRHQSRVATDREKLDTETSMTVVLRF